MTVPEIPWSEFRDYWSRTWRQGEHVTILGPTGRGKTTLALELLPVRDWRLIFAAKPQDPLIGALREQGYSVAKEWPPRVARTEPPVGVVLWPNVGKVRLVPEQKRIFKQALESVYETGGWTLYFDEVRYLTSTLGLKAQVELLWLQGRSLDLSVVAGTQRPAWIPLEAYSQASHLFMFRDNDDRNLARLAGMAGADPRAVRRALSELGRHEVLYLGLRDEVMARTTVVTE